MRTQLLHVVHVADPEAECDYDLAANDESSDSAIAATRTVLSLSVVPATMAPLAGTSREANDDYWLGGYAGI